MRLQGKTALVTGAADERSIGWGIALAFALEGANVVVNDVSHPNELSQRVKQLKSMGIEGLGIQADVTDPFAVDDMIQQTVNTFGQLDIVASNAGIIRWESFLEITPANLRAIVDVNIKGNANICRSVAKQMIKQAHGGRIIITSSVQSDMHFTVTPVYGGTKYAMHSFVGTLALELAPHQITVNHVGPGWIRSALNDRAPDQQTDDGVENNRQNVPLKRDGLPIEIGRAVVYFASEHGDYTTGAFLRVDGGLGISKYSM